MTIRILIGDDHGVMRAGLRALLEDEPDLEVMGEAESAESVIKMTASLLPDVILLDIGLPAMDGIEATRRIKAIAPETQVLILTVYEDESLLREAIRAGASGFIIKRAVEGELITAIQAVSQGYMYVHPAMTHYLVKDLAPVEKSFRRGLEVLTPREEEVMGFIIRGYTNRQIAETLVISIRTVEGHRASIFGKLDLKNRVELIEYAEKMGLK